MNGDLLLFLSKGKMVQINISARKNYADASMPKKGFIFENGSQRNGRRRLDHNFHPLPYQLHGCYNAFFGAGYHFYFFLR